MAETRTVHDPFEGKDVQISDRLVDRLRGKYASGPHLPNGNPEFGWRQFQAPPIQHEAAERIEKLEAALRPFALFWEAQSKLGRPSPQSGELFVVHSGDEPVAITIEDLKTAARCMAI